MIEMKISEEWEFSLLFEVFFVYFFHLFDLAVFIIERKHGFDFPFELVLTEKHGGDVDYVSIGNSE